MGYDKPDPELPYDPLSSIKTDTSPAYTEENGEVTNFYEEDVLNDMAREPMNQEEYDKLYGYLRPKHKHSVLVRKAAKFAETYYKPFTSSKQFINTILSFVPFLRWFPRYPWAEYLPSDIIGGCTMSVVQIPQGIAYAVLANLDPVVGLYISFFPPLFYMLFGTARHNSVGAFAVVALMSRVAIQEYSTLNPLAHSNTTMTDQVFYPPVVVGSTLAFTVGLVHVSRIIFVFLLFKL